MWLDPDFAALVQFALGDQPGICLGSEDSDQVFVAPARESVGKEDGLAFERRWGGLWLGLGICVRRGGFLALLHQPQVVEAVRVAIGDDVNGGDRRIVS